ncbi:MAG TPA: S1C family serine protease [Candidatus Nanopelagicaceae bacterium]|nr:S1C family serine protease [Candidatus Nanopelagicaceae bacterium]
MGSADSAVPSEAIAERPLALRLGAVAVVAAIVGVVVGGGGSFLLLRHYYSTAPAQVTIRNITSGGGSKTTSLSAVVSQVAPSVVEVVRQQGASKASASSTSNGFVASSTGLIVTSEGAVAGAAGVDVVLPSGSVLPATIAAADAATGVVVLQVSTTNLPPALTFAANTPLGAAVIAVSLPLGGTASIDVGTVSEIGLTATVPDPAASSGTSVVDGLVRTDAPEPQGSSGGPLVNTAGQVIGIMTGQRMEPQGQGSTSAFGFGLDATYANYLVQAIAATGGGPKPVGLVSRWLNPASGAATGLPSGAQVLAVSPGSAASVAGLQVGEVVTAVDGTAVQGTGAPRFPDLTDLLISYGPGAVVAVTAVKAGVTQQLSLTLPTG